MTPHWYNLNAKRAYPFVTNASSLPDTVVVDVGLVAGGDSGFDPGEHRVVLAQVAETGADLEFTFTSDAPGLVGEPLVFRCPADSTGFVRMTAEAPEGLSESADDCNEPSWWGFLAVQDLASVLALTLGGSYVPDEELRVEPATVQNLNLAYVSRLSVANADRTRATPPEGCPEFEWPVEPQDYWFRAVCLTGRVQFEGGQRMRVEQLDASNRLRFYPGAKPADPSPCAQVPVYTGETPPPWSPYLDGATGCHQAVRSLGGADGPHLAIESSTGASVTTEPENNKIIIDINFTGLVVCPSEDPD